MKLVKQLLNSWKVEKCSELKLNCEDGVMKVTMTADLGAWIQPQSSVSGNRGHQGPRKKAGLSSLRRQERRAADRAATSAFYTTPASTAVNAAEAPKSARTCKKCMMGKVQTSHI